jgi:Family of unknown function (DUF5985)
MIEGFLLGVIATASVTAGCFFLKFWRDTRDSLFLAFAVAFLIEGLNRSAMLVFGHPHEDWVFIYLVRLFAFLLILGAIVHKNFHSNA